ncbi:MAG: winged helix-turn-helix domain-containing protein [Pirellulales bacterium]
MASRPASRSSDLTPRVKVWVEAEGEYVFGHGLSEILLAVQETGNIKQAAAGLGKSYRHVWSRIKEAEAALGISLVEARVGGATTRRSCLTPAAQELLADFVALRERMLAVVQEEFAKRFRTRVSPGAVRPTRRPNG